MLPCWCRVSETQRSGELTPLWGQLIISPHLSSYSLFSLVVQMLSNSNFITPSHFHFGAKCPGFLLHFMWEGMSIRRELPYITPFFISLLDIITVDQYHIITFDQFNIITLAVKESFSANQYRQDQWTVRFGVPWHVILNLSMSPDTIRAIYLGPLHFVDYDGWDQTSFIVPGTGLLVILCNAAHVFSLLACEKTFLSLWFEQCYKQPCHWLAASFYLSFPRKFHLEKDSLGYDCSTW